MNPSAPIVKATMRISNGLTDASRRGLKSRKDRTNVFPEGGMKANAVPAHPFADTTNTLSCDPIDIVAMDTLFSGDKQNPMAQLFVDYRSRLIEVTPMKSRTHVPMTLKRFLARWWTPRILLHDGAKENASVEMDHICLDRDISQIYRTPGQVKAAVQNFSEPAVGHITRKATFAMVYAGATIRYWVLAIEAACFIDRITAHWYADLAAFSTPYFRVYGQHYPDSSVVQPWGCAALVLRVGGAAHKFKIRTFKMVFVSYAPQHPTYTYGFLNCKTGRTSHSQDAIFLRNEFPFRDARIRMGSAPAGDTLRPRILARSPYAHMAPRDLCFDWPGGPTLPSVDEDLSLLPLDLLESEAPLPADFDDPAPTSPPNCIVAAFKSLSDGELDTYHDYTLAKTFEHPDADFGQGTVTGWGYFNKNTPVTFYNNPSLTESYSTCWEVYNWLNATSTLPSLPTILLGGLPTAPPAAPLVPASTNLADRRPVRACRNTAKAYKCTIDESKPPPTPRPSKKHLLGMYSTFDGPTVPPRTWKVPHLSAHATRAIFKTKQTIFQGGVRIPNSDDDAETSPEWRHWTAGRRLEHVRLGKVNAFRKGLTVQMILDTGYPKSGIVLLQHVYAFKLSGEFRVRCVARGDQQHPDTVGPTFAPTASMYTVRIFFLVAIEESHHVRHGDVPQAFLRGVQDTPLYCWAPRSERSFPGECYQCLLPLYGFRSSSAYWFREARTFLEELGFVMDPLSPCLFRKFLAASTFVQLVLVVDDYAVSGPEEAAEHHHKQWCQKFDATSESGRMFVGYDVEYNLSEGYVKLSFTSYIKRMVERFSNVDLSKGAPFRELVGCCIWCTLNLHYQEIVRVKSHGPRLNDFMESDYDDAIHTMHEIAKLANMGIVYRRGGATRAFTPPAQRPGKTVNVTSPPLAPHQGHHELIDEFEEKDLYTADDYDYDRSFPDYPVNHRYVLSQYVDSAFAVDSLCRSITGCVTLCNGGPLDWACIKESLCVDSTTGSETLSYSSGIKGLKHAELRLKFYKIQPPKPMKMWTDSSGGKLLACNPNKLGRIRHLNIRYHMVKCYVQIGDIELTYCCTEAELADALTKIMDAHQRRCLGARYYNDCIFPDGRFYKVACFEFDCTIKIVTDDKQLQLAQPPTVAPPPSASWSRIK